MASLLLTLELALGKNIPKTNIPRSGPCATLPRPIAKDRIPPMFSTTYTNKVLITPIITTSVFSATPSFVIPFRASGLLKKSSYIVPERLLRFPDNALQKLLTLSFADDISIVRRMYLKL